MSAELINQMTLFPPLNEKEVQATVIDELKEYRALKVKIQNQKERQEAGIVGLFPILRTSDIENELKVKQIDRALAGSLDYIERRIIELKYLSTKEENDLNIYLELGIKKDKYYRKKRSAIKNLATALGII